MKNLGKQNLLGLSIDAIDYAGAVGLVMRAAREGRGFAATALAVHGLMTGVLDSQHRYRLNAMDLVTPDGQPLRWGLNLLHGTGLTERVYGPQLMLDIVAAAAEEQVPIFLYGSTSEKLDVLAQRLGERYPTLQIAGWEASKFRCTSQQEMLEIAARIRDSGAQLTLVGLGCPRQEVFAYEYRDILGMPLVAVGAAFDYHAGLLSEPPAWMQRHGLQWLYRLGQEPQRLWRRYLLLNPLYLCLLAGQYLKVWRPDPASASAPQRTVRYG